MILITGKLKTVKRMSDYKVKMELENIIIDDQPYSSGTLIFNPNTKPRPKQKSKNKVLSEILK